MKNKIVYIAESLEAIDKLYGISKEERRLIEAIRGKYNKNNFSQQEMSL